MEFCNSFPVHQYSYHNHAIINHFIHISSFIRVFANNKRAIKFLVSYYTCIVSCTNSSNARFSPSCLLELKMQLTHVREARRFPTAAVTHWVMVMTTGSRVGSSDHVTKLTNRYRIRKGSCTHTITRKHHIIYYYIKAFIYI